MVYDNRPTRVSLARPHMLPSSDSKWWTKVFLRVTIPELWGAIGILLKALILGPLFMKQWKAVCQCMDSSFFSRQRLWWQFDRITPVVDSKCRLNEKAKHFKFGTCTFPFPMTSRHTRQLMKNQSPKEHGPRSALCNPFLNVGAPCIFWDARPKQFTLPLIRNLLICDSYM